MYPINAASPERIAVGAVVQISDGAVQTSGVSIKVKPQGAAASAGAGTTSYEEGIVGYVPTQAETNYTSFQVIAYKTGCIPVAVTVVTTASAVAGYAGLDWGVMTQKTATNALTNTTVGAVTGLTASDVGAIKTKTDFLPSATAGAAGGLFIAGSNAATTYASMTVTGLTTYTGNMIFSDGITVSAPSTLNRSGLTLTGNGTGSGIASTGGATGNGAVFTGGATSGNGITTQAQTAGDGFRASGVGSARHGISATGGSSGASHGILGQGSDTGSGFRALATGTGSGFFMSGGVTSGNGLTITTTSGHAISATATGTDKHGMILTGGTGGTSDGLSTVAGTGGVPIRGAITGNVTGNLSGSVGSVTGLTASDVAAIKAKTDNLPAAPAATGDIPTALQNADALLGRNIAGGSSSGRVVSEALYALRNRWTSVAGTYSVYGTDDTTVSWTSSLSTDAAAIPLVGSDPA